MRRAHVPSTKAEHAKQEQQHARHTISVPLFHHLAFLRVQRYDLFVVFCNIKRENIVDSDEHMDKIELTRMAETRMTQIDTTFF